MLCVVSLVASELRAHAEFRKVNVGALPDGPAESMTFLVGRKKKGMDVVPCLPRSAMYPDGSLRGLYNIPSVKIGANRMNDIVVGVDRSDTSRLAAGTAASLAADCGAKLHIVMCVKPAPSKEVGVGSDKIIVDWVSEAESFLQNLVRELPHDEITTHVGVGDPAKTMCEEATRLEAKMIVVGNRRVQGMSRVLGSIAADVARHAPCDVLIANTTIA